MPQSSAMAPRRSALVPDSFSVPLRLAGEDFLLRPLTIHDLQRDYEAVMSSREHLQSLDPGSQWPDGLTEEQNLIDLGWHQKEFQRRSSFAYSVVNPADTDTLGCVYIYPSALPGCDVDVFLWARQSELASGLEERLLRAVQAWLSAEWPFTKVRYPGRD